MTHPQFWFQAFLAALTGVSADGDLGHHDVVGVAAQIADDAVVELVKRGYVLDDEEKGKLA